MEFTEKEITAIRSKIQEVIAEYKSIFRTNNIEARKHEFKCLLNLMIENKDLPNFKYEFVGSSYFVKALAKNTVIMHHVLN